MEKVASGSSSSPPISRATSETEISGFVFELLNYTLMLASIKKNQLELNMKPLLKLLFLNQSSANEHTFFSFTETEEEYSLVLEEKEMSNFNRDYITYTKEQQWRAFRIRKQVPLSQKSLSTTDIMSRVTTPLANEKITIFYISTFSFDYLLIETEEVERVLSLKLKGVKFSADQSTATSPPPSHTSTSAPVSLASHNNNSTIMSPPVSESPAFSLSPPLAKPRAVNVQMIINKLPSSLYITKLKERGTLYTQTPLFLQLLFFAESPQRFFSLTTTEEEVTIILDDQSLALIPEALIQKYHESNSWASLQICEGAYAFNECGIISKFVSALKNTNISTLNISAYLTDYALVHEDQIELVYQCLRKKLNILVEGEQ